MSLMVNQKHILKQNPHTTVFLVVGQFEFI